MSTLIAVFTIGWRCLSASKASVFVFFKCSEYTFKHKGLNPEKLAEYWTFRQFLFLLDPTFLNCWYVACPYWATYIAPGDRSTDGSQKSIIATFVYFLRHSKTCLILSKVCSGDVRWVDSKRTAKRHVSYGGKNNYVGRRQSHFASNAKSDYQ